MDYFFPKSILELTTVGFTREEAYKIVQKKLCNPGIINTHFMKILVKIIK